MSRCYKCQAHLTDSLFCGQCGTQVRCNVEGCERVFEGAASRQAHLIDCHPELASSLSGKVIAQGAGKIATQVVAVVGGAVGNLAPKIKAQPKVDVLIMGGVFGVVVLVLLCLLVPSLFASCGDSHYRLYDTWSAEISGYTMTLDIRRNSTGTLTVGDGSRTESAPITWRKASGEAPTILLSQPDNPGSKTLRVTYNRRSDTLTGSQDGATVTYHRVK